MKRKWRTGSVEPCIKFLEGEKFSFNVPSLNLFQSINIPVDLVLNLDETSLSYISPGKYTFDLKGSTTVPIKGVDDKRQITATFTVSAFFITHSTHL